MPQLDGSLLQAEAVLMRLGLSKEAGRGCLYSY